MIQPFKQNNAHIIPKYTTILSEKIIVSNGNRYKNL